MELSQLIKDEVKSNLSQYGLNDLERGDYESTIKEELNALPDTEDKTAFIKRRAQDFMLPAKQLQRDRTRMMQEKSDLEAKIKALETKTEPEKKDEDKPNEKTDNLMLSQLQELMSPFMKKIEDLEKEQSNIKQQEAIKKNKEAIVTEAAVKYRKDIIDLVADGFDFSATDASNNFDEKCNKFCGTLKIPLKTSQGDDKTGKTAVELILEKEKAKEEARLANRAEITNFYKK